ncbi:MAG: ABC transporter permease [Gemmatimonadetes bacterium]|nr:ABC transporter permease [Gemmatimonadota bacterium]
MGVLLADVKYAVRSFSKRPIFTAVLVLTIALGIGSTVAIFSVADAVLFRPLPYDAPEDLALVWTRLPATNVERTLVSGPDLGDYRVESTLFESFAGAMGMAGTLTGEGPAEQIMVGYATWNLFDVLGVTPLLGRSFAADDAFPIDPSAFGGPTPDLPPGTVMLSHGSWQRRFGGDPDVVGRTIQVDGWGSVVAGVLSPDFRIHLPSDAAMPTNIDVWMVLPSNLTEFARDGPWLTVVGRLDSQATLENAQMEMDGIASRLRATHPFHATQNMQIVVNGMHDDVVSGARPALLALLGAVALVLLIACANVANLLLVRATGRGREIAVRAALGSGRGRIVRQMLTESTLLGAAGAVLGTILAWWGVRVIAGLSPGNLPRLDAVTIDGRVLVFTAGITLVASLVFGLAPALRTVAGNLAVSLKDRGSDSGSLRSNRLRTTLVVAEVALSLVLLIGAGLMVRSFSEIQRVDPGFDPENVVTFSTPIPFLKYYTAESRADFVNRLRERLGDIPGVDAVGGVAPLPLAGGDLYSVGSFGRVGITEDDYQANKADYKAVVPGYFEAMDIELVSGRALTVADNEQEALLVAVVDERLASRAFGDEDPIGKELMLDHFNEQTFSMERANVQVVGVVAPVRSQSLAADGRETVYVPYHFNSFLPPTFTVRTAGDPTPLLSTIREELNQLDPDVPMADFATLESHVRDAMAETRFMLALIGSFAVLALVLASLGLYGVISYSARQRTREIGVRVAFGAEAGDVLRLILGQAMVVAGAGVVLGLVVSFAAADVVESLLVGVSKTDPLTYVGVPGLLLAVALAASWVPARRAARVDPVVALRDE